ncbi:MAG: PglZ domain-containing protein, partial [Gammaproteobacteria bacterium]|nr:PglZ domain-containing protein [Gammaproteobacteria bacterium]
MSGAVGYWIAWDVTIGDKAATEGKTFEACRSAVVGLNALVAKVINSLNGNRVLITADHGFLY